MSEGGPSHVPVLLTEVLDLLAPRPGMIVLDGTLGAGGHAEAILERIQPGGLLIGTDRDPEILATTRERLKRFEGGVKLFHSQISQIPELLDREAIPPLDAFLLDLGVSSFQIDRPERGFSFLQDGPLDMRMDRTENCWTAAEIVNRLQERELADLIYQYGDERKSRPIAKAIVERRKKAPFSRTGDLASLIEAVCGRREKIHPATRVFQALRIAANRELEELDAGLAALLPRLKVGGRAAVISFHSLEDRKVKEAFREQSQKGNFRLLTKKPVGPGREEELRNRRSRSAKLRAVERIQ